RMVSGSSGDSSTRKRSPGRRPMASTTWSGIVNWLFARSRASALTGVMSESVFNHLTSRQLVRLRLNWSYHAGRGARSRHAQTTPLARSCALDSWGSLSDAGWCGLHRCSVTAPLRTSTPLGSCVAERLHGSGNLRGRPIGMPPYTRSMGATASRNVITVVLPNMDDVLAAIPAGIASEDPELRARLRLALLNTQVSGGAEDLGAVSRGPRSRCR